MNVRSNGTVMITTRLTPLQHSALFTLGTASLLVITASVVIVLGSKAGFSPVLTSSGVWAIIVVLLWRALPQHPFHVFGAANAITSLRAAITASLAGLIPIAERLSQPDSANLLWSLTTIVVLTLMLDGVDGYVARKNKLSSDFGARFDMEIDALLALVIAVLLWQSGETGLWVLGLGLMRYGFILASVWLPSLRAPLYPSVRRKTVCVIQLAALCAMLSPIVDGLGSLLIGSAALLCLSASFATDIKWLHDNRHSAT